MKHTKRDIILRSIKGEETDQINATVVGCYGVHKNITGTVPGAWAVTHLGTGIIVATKRLRANAIQLAEDLFTKFGDTTKEIYFEDGALCYDARLLSEMSKFVQASREQ